MTRIAGGWRLEDVPLPAGLVHLRASGKTSGGNGNAALGLVEGVHGFWHDDRIFADGFE